MTLLDGTLSSMRLLQQAHWERDKVRPPATSVGVHPQTCSWDMRKMAAEADAARLAKGAPSFHWVSTAGDCSVRGG